MQDDEITLDTQEEQQESEVVEETTGAESQEAAQATSEVKLSPAEYRNFKKWENSKSQPSNVPTKPQQVNSQPNVEEAVLLAQGMSDELLGELKAVAKARNINSLIKAQTDSIFIAVKEKFEKDKKSKEASLPGSRGSGSVKAEKTFASPGLSREEHRKMVLDSR